MIDKRSIVFSSPLDFKMTHKAMFIGLVVTLSSGVSQAQPTTTTSDATADDAQTAHAEAARTTEINSAEAGDRGGSDSTGESGATLDAPAGEVTSKDAAGEVKAAPPSGNDMTASRVETTGPEAPSASASETKRSEIDSIAANFETVWPGYPVLRSYEKYLVQHGRYAERGRDFGTYYDYMYRYISKKRRGGIVMIGIGGALALSSIVLLGVGLAQPEPESSSDADMRVIFLGISGGTFALGAVFSTLGGVKLAKYSKLRERLAPFATAHGPAPRPQE